MPSESVSAANFVNLESKTSMSITTRLAIREIWSFCLNCDTFCVPVISPRMIIMELMLL